MKVIGIRPRFISDYFILDGFHSHIIGAEGAYIIQEQDNPLPWMGAQNLTTSELAGIDYPINVRAKKENLKFTLNFSLLEQKFLPEVTHFLGHIFGRSESIKLELSSDRLKEIYVTPTNQRFIKKYMGGIGNFEIDFTADTPYWLTPKQIIQKTMRPGDILVLHNPSNVQSSDLSYNVYPLLKFKPIQNIGIISEKSRVITEITEPIITEVENKTMITEDSPNVTMTATTPTFELVHLSDKNPGRRIKFVDLQYDEQITMNNRLMQISSSLNTNRFPNWEGRQLFYLHKGYNKFQSIYGCQLEIDVAYPIYQ